MCLVNVVFWLRIFVDLTVTISNKSSHGMSLVCMSLYIGIYLIFYRTYLMSDWEITIQARKKEKTMKYI